MSSSLKQWVFGSGRWTYFLETYDELSESVGFDQKLRYFTDQNGAKRRPHENKFWVFQK